jgi:RDD family
MNCPRCGEISNGACQCDSASAAVPRDAADPSADTLDIEKPDPDSGKDDRAWRDELSDRLSRYRARRKVRPPRYPSLRLPFQPAPPPVDCGRYSSESAHFREPIAESSLALDAASVIQPQQESRREHTDSPVEAPKQGSGEPKTASAKIIEFPRFAWAPPPPPDQLAEPVIDRPRILEVPELTPPPPALGGIMMEPAEAQEIEKRPGIDFPLQSASLTRRMSAAAIDGLIVAVAAALFGLIFWKLTSLRPPAMHIATAAMGLWCLFWAAYQYLLVVYSGHTPGLMAARLELARFDGTPTTRSLRRWRILASYLSAVSVGMGYAWVFLDEDALCWHDRITHTYLAPNQKSAKTQ